MAVPNPLVIRFTRRSRWPSIRAAFWLTFGLGVTSLVVATRATLHLREAYFELLTLGLLLISLAMTLLTPSLVALVAVALTGRDVRSDLHDLLCTTPLSEAALVQGYIFGVLHRLRVLLVVVVGMMPAFVVGMFQFQLDLVYSGIFLSLPHYAVAQNYYDRFHHYSEACTFILIRNTLLILGTVIGMWGMNGVGAALGVGVALRWRKSAVAALAAVLTALGMLLATAALLVVMLAVLGPSIGALATADITLYSASDAIVTSGAAGGLAVIPYALGVVCARLARRWARPL